MEERRLYRSRINRRICGVCGGLGEYFGLDATLIRLAWAILVLVGGSGLLAYFVAALVIPNEPLF